MSGLALPTGHMLAFFFRRDKIETWNISTLPYPFLTKSHQYFPSKKKKIHIKSGEKQNGIFKVFLFLNYSHLTLSHHFSLFQPSKMGSDFFPSSTPRQIWKVGRARFAEWFPWIHKYDWGWKLEFTIIGHDLTQLFKLIVKWSIQPESLNNGITASALNWFTPGVWIGHPKFPILFRGVIVY